MFAPQLQALSDRVVALKATWPGHERTEAAANRLIRELKQVHADTLALRAQIERRSSETYLEYSLLRTRERRARPGESIDEYVDWVMEGFEHDPEESKARHDIALMLRVTELLSSWADLWSTPSAEIERRLREEGELSLTPRGCTYREILRKRAIWKGIEERREETEEEEEKKEA